MAGAAAHRPSGGAMLDGKPRTAYLGGAETLGIKGMAKLPIIMAPDPRLKLKCARVTRVDATIRRLMDDMLETMYAAPGIGLAAPQVGSPVRVIVADIARTGEPPQPLRLANPEIVWASDHDIAFEEGCLSLPEHYAEVIRPAEVRVRYLDHENEIREIEAAGMLATCIQHEMDHLEGVLFVDHISALKRNIILRKLVKAKKAKTPAQPATAAAGTAF
jgi:peptide deformylase